MMDNFATLKFNGLLTKARVSERMGFMRHQQQAFDNHFGGHVHMMLLGHSIRVHAPRPLTVADKEMFLATKCVLSVFIDDSVCA